MLISTAYLPPVHIIAAIAQAEEVTMEVCEHFVRQTLRNRCYIYSPNGPQALVIPIEHNSRNHIAVRDIRISNQHSWQRQHWRSLNAAYRRSAYFEYYMDEFAPFYHQKQDFLIDLNTELLQLILSLLKIKANINCTESYAGPSGTIPEDFRLLSDDKQPLTATSILAYPQVFSYKHGFITGLSIIDLLFNMGPVSTDIILP